MMIQSKLSVTSVCSQKNMFPIHQLTFKEGLRLMGRFNLGCS